MASTDTQSILVVGGGMSGMTAAIEAAEAGYDTYVVERNPYLGGRVAQLHNYFPKLCPPLCGLEINFRRIKNNSRIRFFTMAEVESISGSEGNFDVAIRLNPRYVNEKCTGCGKCAEACSMEVEDAFNYGMSKRKAAYLPHDMAFPMRYVLDPALVKSGEAQKVKEACPYDAIELDMAAKTVTLKVGSIVWASGWKPYDAKKLETYGFGQYPDVITNVMMERLAAWTGPTQGKIVRPSDGQTSAERGLCAVRGVQRPESPALLLRDLLPGFHERGHLCARAVSGCQDLHFLHRHPRHGPSRRLLREGQERSEHPLLQRQGGEDHSGRSRKETGPEGGRHDGGILAGSDRGPGGARHGHAAQHVRDQVPVQVPYDDYGFVAGQAAKPGIYAAGCTRTPTGVVEAVQDGTAAALKAIQSIARR